MVSGRVTLRTECTATLSLALVRGGQVPFIVFPKLDSNTIEANLMFPDGTPGHETDAATRRIEEAIQRINEKYEKQDMPIVRLTRRTVGVVQMRGGVPGQTAEATGSHRGGVLVELIDTSQRNITSEQIIAEWRKEVGEISGAESLTFGSTFGGPGGTPIEFKLLARSQDVVALEKAVEECKAKLRSYPGVFDIDDDSRPGKWEFQVRVKEKARSMGVTNADLAETARASYYGAEVMRLQRGRHEVKLMVRYPREGRRSLGDFRQMRVRVEAGGAERPVTELADVQAERGLEEINRVNQLRSVTISADVDESQGNAREIVRDFQAEFMPGLLDKYPEVRVRWEGQQEQTIESVQSLLIGLAIALVVMFVVLTLEFGSYFQPFLIMAIIPFGAVGAILGHLILGMPLTLFSLFGLVALTGVVVNDSIVLIDFINMRVREGMPLHEALLDAGRRRLRPVFLTSITTIAGLLPLLLERSFQAQILIPMAVSLCFGLMLTTILVLFLVPTFYLLYARLTGADESPAPVDAVEEDGRPSEMVATRIQTYQPGEVSAS